MPEKELSDKIKKNLLDLQHTKYLQYYNTTIIILFTYIIAVLITFITKQVDYRNVRHLVSVLLISIIIISTIIIFMLRFKGHMKNIPREIKKLDLE